MENQRISFHHNFVEKRTNWREFYCSELQRLIDKFKSGEEITPENHIFALGLMDYVHQIDWGGFFPEEFTGRKDE